MGSSQVKHLLTEDVLEDYTSLTYLNKGEIYHLLEKFHSIDPDKVNNNFAHRFTKQEIVNKFEVLKNNPFQDRIFRVFSSQNDDCFSFEDLLDLCSAMSSECPCEVKAAWAFRIYDIRRNKIGSLWRHRSFRVPIYHIKNTRIYVIILFPAINIDNLKNLLITLFPRNIPK
ncbi:calcium and integrin-binding family member 4-like isoform X2 [Colias croceus]|uniref:calcium and integrin-binding family member 4-like isoform X2 n=1 Tax=Colias crocea TaxID=72248 RepID=UPI001E27B946|nr:calcium and integrin-binding family member 4-like isoform X2 [Colias croceus]